MADRLFISYTIRWDPREIKMLTNQTALKTAYILFFLAILTGFILQAENSITYLEGDVFIIRENEEIFADFGTELLEKDSIQTGEDGLVIIDLDGSRTLKMKENSFMVLTETGNTTSLDLNRGSLFSKVSKLGGTSSFSVRTESVVAGVRGTEFFIAFGNTVEENPDIWLCVNEGTVEVALTETDESVLVNQGEGITIPGGSRLTDPRYYEWTEDLNWNTDPDSGPVEDRTSLEGLYSDLLDQDYF